MAAARLRIAKDFFVTFKSGPYVAYGLKAKTKMNILNTEYQETFDKNHFSTTCDFRNITYDKEKRPTSYPKFNRWEVGIIGGTELAYKHFVIGYEISFGLTKLCEGGFIGNPVANVISAVLLGRHPRNMTANLSVAYQF